MRPALSSRLLALALATALSLPVHAQPVLPSLGDAASDDLAVSDERRLGEQIMRDIRRDPAYLDDPVLLDYVGGLWASLVASGRRLGHIGPDLDRPFAWELFLVRDASVNAFALPGGYVGVHLGLIAMTSRPDELASVLAHELSHVTQRHIARSIGSSQRTGMVSLAAMVLGLLIASRAGNADAAQAAIAGGQAAMVQGQLNFSRDMEREADRIGFGMLQASGFAPQAMASMFEKLAGANRLNDSGSFPYLRSHPLTTERIAEANARVPDAGPAPPTPLLYALMRVRASALMDASTSTLRRLQGAPLAGGHGEERLLGLYQRAFVSSRLQDAGTAHAAMQQALDLLDTMAPDPEVRQVVRWLGIEVFLGLGMNERALALAEGAGSQRPALLLRAQAVRAAPPAADPDRARALRTSLAELQAWLADHPLDAAMWHQLAQSAASAGQPIRALRAEAEARAAVGDLNGAIDRLRSVRRTDTADEAIELQVIDARLRALESQRRSALQDDPTRSR
jgi:predicted Zn-dependent protease